MNKITCVDIALYASSDIPGFALLWVSRGRRPRIYGSSGSHHRHYRMQRMLAFQAAYLKRLAVQP